MKFYIEGADDRQFENMTLLFYRVNNRMYDYKIENYFASELISMTGLFLTNLEIDDVHNA